MPPQYRNTEGAFLQLNGNISAMTWQVLGRDKQAYGFKYDDLDRLTEAKYFDLTDVNTSSGWNSTYSTDNKFMENRLTTLGAISQVCNAMVTNSEHGQQMVTRQQIMV
jgi:hypothetical protein